MSFIFNVNISHGTLQTFHFSQSSSPKSFHMFRAGIDDSVKTLDDALHNPIRYPKMHYLRDSVVPTATLKSSYNQFPWSSECWAWCLGFAELLETKNWATVNNKPLENVCSSNTLGWVVYSVRFWCALFHEEDVILSKMLFALNVTYFPFRS